MTDMLFPPLWTHVVVVWIPNRLDAAEIVRVFGRGIEARLYDFRSGRFFQLTELKQGPPWDHGHHQCAKSIGPGGALRWVHPPNSKHRLSP